MIMASAATRLVSRLKLAVAWAGFYFLRGCERLLPTRVLSLLLWPPAAVWDLVQLRERKLVDRWRRFPESWHPKAKRWFLRQSLGLLYHPQLIYIWQDRLRTARWLNRCRLEGGSELIGPRERDRGVVLASLHFGPSEILPYWLRAHGIVATMIGASPVPDSLESLTSYQSALSPPASVPVFLSASEMSPLPRFAQIRQVLGPGPAAACDDRCGPRDTISCSVRKSLVPDGDRSHPAGGDGRGGPDSLSHHGTCLVEVCHSFRYSGAATFPW
jgi:hypothetical protein